MATLISLLLRISLLFYLTAQADLNYETWACPTWPCPTSGQTLLSSGKLNAQLNYDWGVGQVLDSGRSDYVVVHLTGSFVMPGIAGQSYQVYFLNQDDDGSRLKIGSTIVIEDWNGLHGPANRGGGIVLIAGQTYTYERWFSEWGGGAVMRQLWQIYGIHGSYVWMNAGTDFFTAAPQPVYSSGITSGQASRKASETTQRLNQSGNNQVIIQQIGDNNNFMIRQGATTGGKNRMEIYSNGNYNNLNLNQGYNTTGTISAGDSNDHYLSLTLNGNTNTVTTQQTGLGKWNEINLTGNNNSLTNLQTGTGAKILFESVSGNNNTITTNQKDAGNQYLDIKLTGSGHSVTAIQEGAGNHAATIDFTNSGGASSLNLNQSGVNAQTYSIQQSCVNAAGCSTSITQP